MSRTSAIARNTLIQVIGRAAGTVLGLLTLGVMTRYLGTAGYGAFTTVTTFLQFFGILVDFGLSLTAVAMLSEPGADRHRVTSNILTLRILSAAIFFALAPLVVLAFPYPQDVKGSIAVGAASFFLIAVNQILTSILQKELRMGRAALAEVLGRSALFGGVVFVAAKGLPLVWMVGTLVLGNAVTALVNWSLVRTLAEVRWRFDFVVWKDIVARSWPIGMSIAFNLVYLKGDVIVLSLTRSQAEVGLYGAAYKILDVLTVIPIMFMGLVLPLLVKAWAERSHEETNRLLQKSFDFMAVLALPLVAGTWVVGRDLMRLFAGEAFDAAGAMLKLLIIAAACVFFGSLFGHAVIAVRKQREMIAGYAADAVLALIGYIVFIPVYGPAAAAWVTVFSEAFICVATYLVVSRTTGFAPSSKTFLKAAAASAFMALAIHLMPDSVHVLVKVAFGAAVYAGLAVAFGAVTKERLREVLQR